MQASPKSQSIGRPVLPITTFSCVIMKLIKGDIPLEIKKMRTYRLNITMDNVSRVEVFEPLGNSNNLYQEHVMTRRGQKGIGDTIHTRYDEREKFLGPPPTTPTTH